MARRKRSHRKRKVGAASFNPKNPIIMLAAVAGGYLAGDQINDAIDKVIPMKDVAATATTAATKTPYVSGTITGGVEAGVGALLLLKGKPNIIKTVVGGLMAGAGIKRLLKETGVISGFQSVPVIGRRRVGGYPSVPVVGGIPNALKGYVTNRAAADAGAMGMVPNMLKGYTTSMMPAMGSAGF